MKNKLFFICVCMLALCAFGCDKKDNGNDTTPGTEYPDEFVVGQDSNYMFQMDNNGSMFTKTEDGYYFDLGRILYYADAELETVLPLCTITNCKHIGQGDACEGYVGISALMGGIQYYNGKLYVDSQIDLNTFSSVMGKNDKEKFGKLFEISADGSERKDLNIKVSGVTPIIHRGYVYNYYMEEVEEENNGETRTVKCGVLARINIETGKEERILDKETKRILNSNWIQEIYAYGNYVYFRDVDEEIYLYSIKDDSIKLVEDLKNIKFWFMDDKLLYKSNLKSSEEYQKVYVANLDFSEPQYAFSLENGRYDIGSDGLYIYADNRFPALSEGTDRILYYYDKDTYEYIGEINLGPGVVLERYGFGDDKYYFYIDTSGDKPRFMYFEKAALATGNIELKVLIEWPD